MHGNISATRSIAIALCCSKIRDLTITHDLKRYSSQTVESRTRNKVNVKHSVEIEKINAHFQSLLSIDKSDCIAPIRCNAI